MDALIASCRIQGNRVGVEVLVLGFPQIREADVSLGGLAKGDKVEVALILLFLFLFFRISVHVRIRLHLGCRHRQARNLKIHHGVGLWLGLGAFGVGRDAVHFKDLMTAEMRVKDASGDRRRRIEPAQIEIQELLRILQVLRVLKLLSPGRTLLAALQGHGKGHLALAALLGRQRLHVKGILNRVIPVGFRNEGISARFQVMIPASELGNHLPAPVVYRDGRDYAFAVGVRAVKLHGNLPVVRKRRCREQAHQHHQRQQQREYPFPVIFHIPTLLKGVNAFE